MCRDLPRCGGVAGGEVATYNGGAHGHMGWGGGGARIVQGGRAGLGTAEVSAGAVVEKAIDRAAELAGGDGCGTGPGIGKNWRLLQSVLRRHLQRPFRRTGEGLLFFQGL